MLVASVARFSLLWVTEEIPTPGSDVHLDVPDEGDTLRHTMSVDDSYDPFAVAASSHFDDRVRFFEADPIPETGHEYGAAEMERWGAGEHAMELDEAGVLNVAECELSMGQLRWSAGELGSMRWSLRKQVR